MAASKCDPTAQGVARTLGCACPSALCPVKAMKSILPGEARADSESFVIKNVAGKPCTKAEVIAEARKVAEDTGSPGLVTGHSLRVTGAQRLALAGVNETRIITFGR